MVKLIAFIVGILIFSQNLYANEEGLTNFLNQIDQVLKGVQKDLESRQNNDEQPLQLQEENKKIKDSIDDLALKIKKAVTPTNPTVRIFALRLARQFPGEYNLGQICAIWYFIKNKWSYVNDPNGFDYFAPANETIDAELSGDCDDFAILMSSLIQAIGGSTRVILAYGSSSGHAYTEVYFAKNKEEAQEAINSIAQIDANYYNGILKNLVQYLNSNRDTFNYRNGPDGCWLNLDWGADHPGGPYFSSISEIAIYPDGKWEMLKTNGRYR